MPTPEPHTVRRARPLLGTLVEIAVSDDRHSQEKLHAAVSDAFAEVERVHRLMSFHEATSDLSLVNRHALSRPVRVHADTYKVFEMALNFSWLTQGAFDPTVAAPILESSGYLPSCRTQCDPGADWRDIELLGDTCIRYRRAVRADLGGIAKGFAVDLAVCALAARDIEDVLVNAGGDLRVAGPRSHGVRLRHPVEPLEKAYFLEIKGRALATSAPYFSRRKDASNREMSALVDPVNRMPELDVGSVTVLASDCASADALTKAVLFASREVAERSLAVCGAEACVIK
ncbi:MAG TPA: FAD:protein FMN transferase [Steroidobacteraceae bacterium]